MMHRNRRMQVWAMLMCVGSLTIPVYGEAWDFTWDHPCDWTNLTCPLAFPPPPCYCVADYNDANNWSSTGGGYPDASTDDALIEHSNTGYCNGGTDDGLPCSQNSDCAGAGNDCEDYEDYLKVCLIDETIDHLRIRSDDFANSTDETLEVRFSKLDVCTGGTNSGTECTDDNDCTGGGTCDQSTKVLTVTSLLIDAADGQVTLKATAGNLETQ